MAGNISDVGSAIDDDPAVAIANAEVGLCVVKGETLLLLLLLLLRLLLSSSPVAI